MITFDFETRSPVDLKKAGAWVYSIHELTQVLCFAWQFDDDENIGHWHRATPGIPQSSHEAVAELIARLEAGEPIEAHNSFFEFCIWMNCLIREFPEFPPIPIEQWWCSAAKAAYMGLPRSLDEAAKALRLQQRKDEVGYRLMLKCSRPRKPYKAELIQMKDAGIDPDSMIFWNEKEDDIKAVWSYNEQDVRTEHGVSSSLRPLPEFERRLFLLDAEMNIRGIQCDLDLAHIAVEMAKQEKVALNLELSELTNEVVERASMRVKLLTWIHNQGVPLEDTKKLTVAAYLHDRPMPDNVRRALEICQEVNKTSTAKYSQMIISAGPDGKIRGTQMFLGAERTGRWAGRGVQPHNFVRGFSDYMDEACEDIMTGDREFIRMMYPGIMDMLSKSARGALISSPGKKLIVADYSAIEARVLLWLAMDEAGLDIFRRGEDIYCEMAESIYNHPVNKRDHPVLRQVGKTSILGLGFQMGYERFLEELAKNDVPQERDFAKHIVKTYRTVKFPKIASFWDEIEEAAVTALTYREDVECRRLLFGVRGRFLMCKLPSGRTISYLEPMYKPAVTHIYKAHFMIGGAETTVMVTNDARKEKGLPFSAEKAAEAGGKILDDGRDPIIIRKNSISYKGSVKGKLTSIFTYGGKLTENVTQAVARDLLAYSMVKVDDNPLYDLLMAVHDEVVAEVDENMVDLKAYEKLVSEKPAWATSLPVEAEGWTGQKYKKG